MDISYVSPTGAGVPLNLDIVGIAISNFDTSIFVNVTNFSSNDQMLIEGKLKPRYFLPLFVRSKYYEIVKAALTTFIIFSDFL